VANVRDFGHGDLRDILQRHRCGHPAAPIDDSRLGITGGSYGGYFTMWAITQTQRFKAAVAQAGISDWLSYYGENGIDQWLLPYFGASVYADPSVYARSSPINYIRNVRTPTLEFVGENDIECPAPQTQEFWHALQELGVPTTMVIYPQEGHGLRDPAHLEDAQRRVLGWFDQYLKPTQALTGRIAMTVTGQCLCGTARYEFDTSPITARICWCRLCQKIGAGSATVNVGFASASLRCTANCMIT
jgi:dipeptidyl aminopeptidase/acylaminoacyl peptidase